MAQTKELASEVKDLVRTFREALGLTQEQVAVRGGLGEKGRSVVNKVETGRNKAGSFAIRRVLADGFGIGIVDLDGYLLGKIELEAAVKLAGGASNSKTKGRGPSASPAVRASAA